MNEADLSRLLLALVEESWDEAERMLAGAVADPLAFEALIRECDVHPWIHARLQAAGRFELVGSELQRRLEALRHKCRMDNLLLLARAEQAFDRLLAAGLVPVALKGLDLLHRAYHGFDERTLDDVDLLVHPGDVGRCLAALEGAGWVSLPEEKRDHYLRSSHHLPLSSPGPIPVDFEIHWNLAQTGRYRLDAGELMERAVPLEVAGRSVLRLEDHDLAAHLILHHFTHYFDRRLKWCVDLRWIAARPGFDWAVVAGRLRSWGASAAAGMSILHLRKLFPDLIPEQIQRLLPVAPWRRLLSLPLRSRHPLDLFSGTRSRKIQLYLAAVMLENPLALPAWMLHRTRRDRQPEHSPLDGQEDKL